jgi:hypothetical protein
LFDQEMLACVLEVAKARCKQIWSSVKENDVDTPPPLEAANVVCSARALATAEATVSAATQNRETKLKPAKRKGEARGHYNRKSKALKLEFRKILYTHGAEEAIASMVDQGVPESTARGWANPDELVKPLPAEGKNRTGAGRSPAYSLEQLRPVYDKASERKHLVGRVDDKFLRRVCKTDLPTVDGYDMQFSAPSGRRQRLSGFRLGKPLQPSRATW